MQEPKTSAQLRDEIDRGQAADKVSFPDPAAAPLGTDDEAAGHPPTPEQIALARKHEVRQPPAARPGLTDRFKDRTGYVLLIAAVLLIAIVVYFLR